MEGTGKGSALPVTIPDAVEAAPKDNPALPNQSEWTPGELHLPLCAVSLGIACSSVYLG